ncbi:hypothetical protein QY886_05650 [Latilactobacillus sakei]
MTIEAAQIQRVLSPELRDLLTLSVQQVLPSTNAYLLQQPMRDQQWSVVIAQQQTQGRGQRDHQFASPIGGLYLSLLMPVRDSAQFNTFQQTAAALVLHLLRQFKPYYIMKFSLNGSMMSMISSKNWRVF